MRPMAVFQSVSTNRPPSRTSGVARRSGLDAHGHDPYRPFGPSRPWFTTSVGLPRTPTITPSFTAISQPHPLLHSTHAERTQRSTSATFTDGSRYRSTRVGHASSRRGGVLGPQMSAMRSVMTPPLRGRRRRPRRTYPPHLHVVRFGTAAFDRATRGSRGG